ncbi:sensor histidine kinase [Psychrosphaera haliotis]|uniref:Sensor histidine kinase n=1 Tax=Psychrosphaera haliotis TaxID=555083 RepID=A0A6N8FE36_9GAMM|nr:sensor histidine kinase [Psychrosphaera haliotis]MUH72932.1 sensor histidine kinase [Psychrosphaera haliotis]
MNSEASKSFIIPPIANTAVAKWSYFSLIFSVFYFFNVIANFEAYSVANLAVIAFIYLTFIALFILITRANEGKAALLILLVILLSGMGAYFTPGTSALFGYAAFFSGFYFSKSQGLILFLANIVTQFLAAYIFNYWSPFFLGPTLVISSSLFVYGVFSQKEFVFNAEQDEKNQQIEQISTIAERERIARDMHDLLGHTLSSLALKSELSQKLMEKKQFEMAAQEIGEVASLARSCLSEVRHAVSGLKQTGLSAKIISLGKELDAMNFNVTTDIQYKKLDAKTESALIMIFKEATTNILKHSNGNEVHFAIKQTDDDLKVTISDNGTVSNIKIGNGLQGIKSRVEELDGTFYCNKNKENQNFTLSINLKNDVNRDGLVQ